jgi:hypothetical protein
MTDAVVADSKRGAVRKLLSAFSSGGHPREVSREQLAKSRDNRNERLK